GVACLRFLAFRRERSTLTSLDLANPQKQRGAHDCRQTNFWSRMRDFPRFCSINVNSPPATRTGLAMYFATSLLILAATTGHAAKLKPEAQQGWNRYVALTEARIDREQSDPSHFLWIDVMPEEQKKAAEAQLTAGQVVIDRLRTEDNGMPIK